MRFNCLPRAIFAVLALSTIAILFVGGPASAASCTGTTPPYCHPTVMQSNSGIPSSGGLAPGETLLTQPPTSSSASISFPAGPTPSSHTEGDCWNDNTAASKGLYCFLNGAVVGPLGAPGDGGGSGGSGLFAGTMSAIPTLANTGFSTWINQGSTATAANVANGILLQDTTSAGANSLRLFCKATPSTPFTIVALFAAPFNGATNDEQGIALENASTQHIENYARVDESSPEFIVADFTNPTTFSSTPLLTGVINVYQWWAKIVDNGTTITFSISPDGIIWDLLFTDTISSGWFGGGAPNRICLVVNPLGSANQ